MSSRFAHRTNLPVAWYASYMGVHKARVRNGKLELEEPVALIEGFEFWVVPIEGDGTIDERAELSEALLEAIADVEAGRTVDAEEAIAALRTPPR